MPANLNVPATYDEMQALGVAFGRQFAAAFAIQHGTTPADRERASGDELDGIEEVEDVLRPIEQRAPGGGGGSDLAYAFRTFVIDHLSKHQAFTTEMQAHDAAIQAGR